jgi:hypothetical protein
MREHSIGNDHFFKSYSKTIVIDWKEVKIREQIIVASFKLKLLFSAAILYKLLDYCNDH